MVWSRSLHATADLFLVLKRGREDPDAASAALVGLDDAARQPNNVANAPAREVLLRMPGAVLRTSVLLTPLLLIPVLLTLVLLHTKKCPLRPVLLECQAALHACACCSYGLHHLVLRQRDCH